jgi:hypothetical protein
MRNVGNVPVLLIITNFDMGNPAQGYAELTGSPTYQVLRARHNMPAVVNLIAAGKMCSANGAGWAHDGFGLAGVPEPPRLDRPISTPSSPNSARLRSTSSNSSNLQL